MKKLITIMTFALAVIFGGLTNEAKAANSADINSFTVKQNVWQNLQDGMVITFYYTVHGMRGQNSRGEVTLYKADGSKIYLNNGQLAQYSLIWQNLGYDHVRIQNQWIFFPYKALKLPSGSNRIYAILRIYNATTGKLLKTSGKLQMTINR